MEKSLLVEYDLQTKNMVSYDYDGHKDYTEYNEHSDHTETISLD